MATQAEKIATNAANIKTIIDYNKIQNGHIENISRKVDSIVKGIFTIGGMLFVGLLGIAGLWLK